MALDVDAEWAAARAAWPGVEVPREVFERHVAARSRTHAVDLYLACGCLRGDRAALEAFETRVLPEIASAVRRLAPDPDFVAEVHQRVRAHLFVGDAPRIADYQGHGPLAAWVRIVAVRFGLQLLRTARTTARQHGALAAEPELPFPDLERDLIKESYRVPFREAFAGALATLSPHERNVIQLHFIEGLSLSELGKLHGVNKSTVSRWIAHARTRIETELRTRLQDKLGLHEDDLDSLLGVLRSRIDLSLERLLAPADDPEAS